MADWRDLFKPDIYTKEGAIAELLQSAIAPLVRYRLFKKQSCSSLDLPFNHTPALQRNIVGWMLCELKS